MVGFCLAPEISVAQTTDRPEIQEDFRKRVVRSWRWKPKNGIGLTTTKYARDYLFSHYFDSSGQWKGDSGGLSREALLNTPLVLFQSERLDIVVLKRTPLDMSPYGVAILRRDSADFVQRDNMACHNQQARWKFVDADGEKPLEVMNVSYGGCASNLTVEVFRLFDATDGKLLISQKAVADYGGRCPKFLSHMVGEVPRRQTRDASGHLVFEFRMWFRMHTRHETGYCSAAAPKTFVRRTCEYDSKAAQYECTDAVVTAHTLALSDIKTCWNWEGNAENIRWVMENADELRARGFRFPNGFLERLPRHLP